MSFALRHQPLNAIYTLCGVIYILAALPVWLVLHAIPASRQRKSWTMQRILIGRVVRTYIDIMWKTSLPPPPSLPQHEQNAHSLGFVWIEPALKLVVGEVSKIAKENAVDAERVGGFWYGPRDSNNRAGQRAFPGERVVYHLHGGGHVMGSAHPNGGVMPIYKGYLEHLGPNLRVFSLEYRLSSAAPFKPANPFPASLLDAISGYRYLVEDVGFDPHNIILSGDSAGGGIMFNLARYLATANLPSLPNAGGLILLSPAMDWGQTHVGADSSITRNYRDCIVSFVFECGYSRRALVGSLPEEMAARSTWISPGALHAEWQPGMFAGFPRTIIVAGGVECNLDAMRMARDRLMQDNGKDQVTFIEPPDALHDFLLFGQLHEPERTYVLKELGAWADLVKIPLYSVKVFSMRLRLVQSLSTHV